MVWPFKWHLFSSTFVPFVFQYFYNTKFGIFFFEFFIFGTLRSYRVRYPLMSTICYVWIFYGCVSYPCFPCSILSPVIFFQELLKALLLSLLNSHKAVRNETLTDIISILLHQCHIFLARQNVKEKFIIEPISIVSKVISRLLWFCIATLWLVKKSIHVWTI